MDFTGSLINEFNSLFPLWWLWLIIVAVGAGTVNLLVAGKKITTKAIVFRSLLAAYVIFILQVYAYGSSSALTTLALAEPTSPMTTQMTMKNISSADYAGIDDINVMITGYAVGTAEVSDIDPSSAWLECKQKYNVQ